VDAHDGVGVEETAWVGAICADSTHDRGQVNQNLRPVSREEALDGIGARQIVFLVERNEDIATAHPLEPLTRCVPRNPAPPVTTVFAQSWIALKEFMLRAAVRRAREGFAAGVRKWD
jgi:hypothetical protein